MSKVRLPNQPKGNLATICITVSTLSWQVLMPEMGIVPFRAISKGRLLQAVPLQHFSLCGT